MNNLIKTSDRLMRVANKNIVSMVLSELDEEDRKDIDISEYLSCYSRVRTGEIWTKEMGKATAQVLVNSAKQWKEI